MRAILKLIPITALLSAVLVMPSAATATTDPGGGGSACSVLLVKVVRSTTVTVTLKGYCDHPFTRWNHGMTLQRPGKTVTSTTGCTNFSGITSCTKSISISNPAGSQQFVINDEWSDYHAWPADSVVHHGRFTLAFTA